MKISEETRDDIYLVLVFVFFMLVLITGFTYPEIVKLLFFKHIAP